MPMGARWLAQPGLSLNWHWISNDSKIQRFPVISNDGNDEMSLNSLNSLEICSAQARRHYTHRLCLKLDMDFCHHLTDCEEM